MKKILFWVFFVVINAGAMDMHAAAASIVEEHAVGSVAETDNNVNPEEGQEVVATTILQTTTSQKVKGAFLGLGCGLMAVGVADYLRIMAGITGDHFESLPFCFFVGAPGLVAIVGPIEYLRRRLANSIEANRDNEPFLSRRNWKDRTTTDKISYGTFLGGINMYVIYKMYVDLSSRGLL